MSEQDVNGLNGDVSPTDIYQFSSAEAQERAFKGKIKQLSGDTLISVFLSCRPGININTRLFKFM